VGIHRHLHQPNYWGEPATAAGRPKQSQYAQDSQALKDASQAYYGDTIQHPENQLVGGNNSVFENPDKQQAYQVNIKKSIGAMDSADAGMTISFSGALQRNLWSFGRYNQAGYTLGWNNDNITAYNWKTSGGVNSRAEVLGQTYHHAFTPLLPKSALRKEIEMHRERTRKSWGLNPNLSDQSKGFWPIELAFSRHIIPVLAEYGYQWVMIPNSHLARTCPNYMDALAQPNPGAELKADPPNRADQIGPTVPLNQWYGANRDTYGNVFPVPFAYQAHKAKYVDPETGAETKITVVPQCDYHGYQSGYAAVGWEHIDGKITQYNDPNQPCLVMLTNDGENFWGGGNSFWNEFAPNFMDEAPGHGKKAITIQEFLSTHPAPENDVVHVEDGSWLAADQGSPQFYRWLEPPRRISGIDWSNPNSIFDLENGWHSDMRNWAVMLAGVNHCETAEQIFEGNGGEVLAWRIEEPYQDGGTDNNPNATEQAWHFLLWGFDSGFLYFGDTLDDEVKHTFAANRAISLAAPVIGDASQDLTPPTVFKPQRFPWNPGGKGKGQYLGGLTSGGGTVGFTTPPWPSDFYIWTFAYDLSGVNNVTLKIRVDGDGVNPLNDNANELYAGGAGVGSWVSLPMNYRQMPKNDPTGSSGLRFFVLPDEIADYYWFKVSGYRDVLLDYYIEATDSKGNLVKTDIQHVYVEDDGTAGSSSAAFSADPRDCAPLVTTFSATNGPLEGVSPVFLQISFSNGQNYAIYQMTSLGPDLWVYTNTVPDNAPNATVWFQNTGNTISDNNNDAHWFTVIRDCDAPQGPSTASVDPPSPVGCDSVTVRYYPNGQGLQTSPIYMHIGHNGWLDVLDPKPVMTDMGTYWEAVYDPPEGTYVIDVVFTDGPNWDNNNNLDWHFGVTGCEAAQIAPGITITNPAAESVAVAEDVSTYSLQGTASTNIASPLMWTNALTGEHGTLSSSPAWLVAALPLAYGTNQVTVSGLAAGPALSIAADSGDNPAYDPAWDNGDDGGTGWGGAWALSGSANSGYFRATSGGNANLSVGPVAWGLWSKDGATADAVRPFASNLQTGQSFSVRMDNNWIQTGGAVGFGLQNNSGNNLLELYFSGGGANYTVKDSLGDRDTGRAYTANGLNIDVLLQTPTTYKLTIGTTVVTGSLIANADQAIRRFRAFSYNSRTGNTDSANYDFFFNDIKISEPGTPTLSNDTVTIVRETMALWDGIPSGWWQRYGLESTNKASANWDSDVSSNWDEWVADTDPTNPASFFQDQIFEFNLGGSFLLMSGTPTTNTRVYDVWASTSLVDGVWSPLGLNVPGAVDGAAVELHVPDDTGPFLRTGVKLP